MLITVELTYEMSKTLGERRIELTKAQSVAEVVEQTAARFASDRDQFEKLSRVSAIAVNGVLVGHRKGLKTKLESGDRVTFVKAAAGG